MDSRPAAVARRRAWAPVVALCCAVASAPLHAAPADAPADDPALREARELHEEGQALFDTADFQGAIEAWTRAYAALPDRPESAAMRPFMLYNIATAREKAYEVFGDVTELRQARVLLRGFDDSIDSIYADADERDQERERVQARIAELDARIEAHESKAAPAVVTPADPAPATEPTTGPTSEPTGRDDGDAAPRPDGRLISGAVLVALGGVAGAVGLAGVGLGVAANDVSALQPDDLSGRDDLFARGRAGNAMGIAGAVAAPLLLGAGIALIVLAKTRPRSHGTTARWRPRAGGIALSF